MLGSQRQLSPGKRMLLFPQQGKEKKAGAAKACVAKAGLKSCGYGNGKAESGPVQVL